MKPAFRYRTFHALTSQQHRFLKSTPLGVHAEAKGKRLPEFGDAGRVVVGGGVGVAVRDEGDAELRVPPVPARAAVYAHRRLARYLGRSRSCRYGFLVPKVPCRSAKFDGSPVMPTRNVLNHPAMPVGSASDGP